MSMAECNLATGLWDVSNADYHAHDAISHSRLEVFRASPVEFEARYVLGTMPHPKPSASMILGTALHVQIMEPEKWDELISVEPEINGRTNEGKAARAAFAESSKGKTVITKEQSAAVVKMAKSALAHPEVQEIVQNAWKREQGMRCVSPIGLPLRAKLDIVCHFPLIADFKSAVDVSPDGFARACATWGYHRQGALYSDVAKAVLGKSYTFVNIAVQNSEPWECACFVLDKDDIALGRDQNNRDLARLKECYETNEWRGPQNTGIMKLKLPKWASYVE